MTKTLEIKDLSYRKSTKKILERVNLSLEAGQTVALLGANGAGKTSLMRVIAGVAKHYKGQVSVCGETDEDARKQYLAMTDNLAYFKDSVKIKDVEAFYQGVYGDFDQEQFGQILEFMNLNQDEKLGALSKGMKEKLVIALTFARKAKLYLLDEPFSGIDVMSRKKIVKSLLLWKPEDATLVISDHVLGEVATIIDEVVLVKNHSVLEQRSADEIREKHESLEEWYEGFYEGEE
ncbi:ATP-binding cassette domain-containing protein [Lactobacillus sp.]|uniref:ATP-binding cassette domain-containing protein n=1 Tax=Lactobacillus sp. TaxID=1591 RepID=UPI003EF8C25D